KCARADGKVIGSRTAGYRENSVVRLAHCCRPRIAADRDEAFPRGGCLHGSGHLSDAATRGENDTKQTDQTNTDGSQQNRRRIAMNSYSGENDGGHCTPSSQNGGLRTYQPLRCTLTVVLITR